MNNLTILVVDDDPVIRRLLEQRLAKENYTVLLAEDGHKAENILQGNHVDVVLTDLMMPGDIGGIEVIDIAKDLNRNIEVILITAHSSIDTAVEAMKKGAADYLEKPINFTELFLRLEKIATMRSILRSAEDLRQAMDVTETNAAATIQNLELAVGNIQHKLDTIESILTDDSIDSDIRVTNALNILLN
ncbi:MAG: response regulator [Proteobacteria bacterium]|nr:response regulator [Pseudomonadota bacterium]MBU1234626.1 response regulator [Pseudomonadota bacterium]MBU1416999.1 response regulator [Pseudomonadota bacterium]MBU1453695.1 response regulator [Pseudomonadota bacterium]